MCSVQRLLASGLLLLGSCVGQRGHPVRTSLPRLTAPEIRTLGIHALPEPEVPGDEDAKAMLFSGLEGLLPHVEALRSVGIPDPRAPVLVPRPALERAVARRYRRGGFGGPVRVVGAMAVVGRVPLAPGAMADIMMDPVAEQQVLAADTFRLVGVEYVTPQARRNRYLIEILRIGAALWVYDMRFTMAAERRALSDGSVLLRYDPRVPPRPEHVTLWRGACFLEPDGAGTRVMEVLIIGTDVSLPPFLVGALRKMVRDKISDRAQNLWKRAWQ
jgi:hypothetical protein